MAFLFFQIIQVALIKIPVSLNQYPPKRIRTHCHPLGKWCRVTDQVEAFEDHFIIPKNRIDCHHFGMQVSNPNQAVTFYPIPDIILHIQMHRISSSLPYLIQAFVITSERTFVRDILKNRNSPYLFEVQFCRIVQKVNPGKPETGIPDFQDPKPRYTNEQNARIA